MLYTNVYLGEYHLYVAEYHAGDYHFIGRGKTIQIALYDLEYDKSRLQ